MNDEAIMKGAEPFFLKGGDTGVLLSHGFTGTTQSMRYLGEALNRFGYTVSAPRLKGHGVSPAAMAKSSAGEWIASLEDALPELQAQCKRVFIGGLSMGGALTLYMAGKHANVFAGAFPINAVIHVDSPDLAGLPLDRNSPAMIPGIGSDVKDPASKELAYEEVPVAALKELFALIAVTRELRRGSSARLWFCSPATTMSCRPPMAGRSPALSEQAASNWSGLRIPITSRQSTTTRTALSPRFTDSFSLSRLPEFADGEWNDRKKRRPLLRFFLRNAPRQKA